MKGLLLLQYLRLGVLTGYFGGNEDETNLQHVGASKEWDQFKGITITRWACCSMTLLFPKSVCVWGNQMPIINVKEKENDWELLVCGTRKAIERSKDTLTLYKSSQDNTSTLQSTATM